MKLSMMSYTMTRSPDFDLEAMFKLTRELEMDGVDICFPDRFEKPAGELRRMLDGHGLHAVCCTFPNNVNEPGMTESRWRENLSRGLEQAVVLGAPTVMIPTPGIDGLARAANRARWIEALAGGIEPAEKAGVTLTVENFPGASSPFVVAADLMEAVRRVPGLKITFDNGNAATGEDPATSFRDCAEHVVHVHFKDWETSDSPADGFREMLDGRFYRPALIGEGAVDHRACIRAMARAGYRGWINIEYEGNKYTPAEGVRRAAAYLRGVIGREAAGAAPRGGNTVEEK